MSFFNIYLSMTPQISVKNQDFGLFQEKEKAIMTK